MTDVLPANEAPTHKASFSMLIGLSNGENAKDSNLSVQLPNRFRTLETSSLDRLSSQLPEQIANSSSFAPRQFIGSPVYNMTAFQFFAKYRYSRIVRRGYLELTYQSSQFVRGGWSHVTFLG
jgi:hypothetical protein